jgi:UPF0755 protein
MARTKAGKRLLVLGGVLLLAGGLSAGLGFICNQRFKGYAEPQKLITIPRGTPSYEVARMLQREGVVRHWSWFLIYLKTVKGNARLQAGEYSFDEPLSVIKVANKLIRGLVYYHELTVPEGFSVFEIAELLENKGFCSSTEFWTAAGRGERVSQFENEPKNLEGFLFPDTYRITRGTAADDIVGMMLKRFEEVYSESLEQQVQKSSLRFHEVLTLASLIEKETGIDDERELVSAVFHNRLKRRMPLQCDPTVIYASKLNGSYRGKIFESDLKLDSPYNTYRRIGLPPGPIANPGKRSIEAALKPADVDYLYFVANNLGGHVFSKTLEAHQRAVAAYRRGLNHSAKPGPDNEKKG